MAKFKKKSPVINAVQYDGTEKSVVEIMQMESRPVSSIRVDAGDLLLRSSFTGLYDRVKKGDWIIQDTTTGFLIPCDNDVFRRIYKPVE